jgi:uncharacterized protein YlxW (UPF0749 family)
VKKLSSQIMLGIICCILGFMLAHQFKELSGNGNKIIARANTSGYNDLTTDNEQLKKVKEELEKKNNEVLEELKKYENQASSNDQKSKDMKVKLDESRVLLGMSDVEGQGVTIYITPKSAIFNNNGGRYLQNEEILFIINELNFAGVEAVAVNDNRIVSQSVIKNSNSLEFLIINEDKVSVKNRIVIKAIGDKNILDKALNYEKLFDFQPFTFYDIKIEKSDNIKIPKYNKTYNDEFLK